MPSNQDWLNTVLAGLGALGGGLENRATTSNSIANSTNNSTNVSSPIYDPANLGFYNSIRDKYIGLLGTDPDLKGYQANQIQGFNNTARIQSRAAQERMAANGISGPAAVANLNDIDAQRFAKINTFNNSIPLLSRQMNEDTLSKALSAFSFAPKTTMTTGTSTNASNGTTQNSGNVAGGAVGGLSKVLAMIFGAGGFGPGSVRGENGIDIEALANYLNNQSNIPVTPESIRDLLMNNPGTPLGNPL